MCAACEINKIAFDFPDKTNWNFDSFVLYKRCGTASNCSVMASVAPVAVFGPPEFDFVICIFS